MIIIAHSLDCFGCFCPKYVGPVSPTGNSLQAIYPKQYYLYYLIVVAGKKIRKDYYLFGLPFHYCFLTVVPDAHYFVQSLFKISRLQRILDFSTSSLTKVVLSLSSLLVCPQREWPLAGRRGKLRKDTLHTLQG